MKKIRLSEIIAATGVGIALVSPLQLLGKTDNPIEQRVEENQHRYYNPFKKFCNQIRKIDPYARATYNALIGLIIEVSALMGGGYLTRKIK